MYSNTSDIGSNSVDLCNIGQSSASDCGVISNENTLNTLIDAVKKFDLLINIAADGEDKA